MSTHDIKTDCDNGRRNALRGLLATGCGLFLPMVAGCKDRQAPGAPQGVPETTGMSPPRTPTNPVEQSEGPAPPSAEPLGPAPDENPDTSRKPIRKMTRNEVQLNATPKSATPNNASSHPDQPGTEKMFANSHPDSPPNSHHFQARNPPCDGVAGELGPQGWCKLWAPEV